AHVEVEALLPTKRMQALPEPRPEPPVVLTLAAESGGIFLQLGAFSNPANAENFSARVRRQLDWVKEPLQVTGRNNLYRVQLGPYRTRSEAAAAAQKIREQTEVK